jgi:hypothetical protein
MRINNLVYKVVKSSLISLVVLSLLIAFTSVAFAILFNINTNDGSVAEWESQSIQVFQTDDPGDVSPAADDIVDTWMASGPVGGPDKVYFRMQTNAGTALSTNSGAVAAFDCNNNGEFDNVEDKVVVYIRDCYDGGTSHEERVTLANGNQTNVEALGPEAGQAVGSYLEWSVNIAGTTQALPDGCRDTVPIRFYTSDVTGMCQFPPSPAIIIDETPSSPWTGWDIPNAIEMREFEASSTASYATVTLVALIVAGAGSAGLVALAWWRRK